MPRDKGTGKSKGFAFLMYEDQRSTVLAVDNLNGAKVRNRTLKVDHVKDYKQPKIKGEDGEYMERDEQSLNARPELIYGAQSCYSGCCGNIAEHSQDDAASESSVSSAPSIDPEDPMRDYLLQQRKEEKIKKSKTRGKSKSKKAKKSDETPEERRARKERKRARRAAKERVSKPDDGRREHRSQR